jgi:Protein of unknown function (DUF3500)
MNIPPYRSLLLLFVSALLAASPLLVSMQRTPDGTDATLKAIAAAQAFLSTLNEHQRKVVNVELNEDTRTRWSNLPTGIAPYPRNGMRLGDLTPAQQEAALKLVAAPLSPGGYQKVINIVNGDEVFKTMAPSLRFRENTTPVFGRGEFYVAILGTPSATTPWMIQLGGHHLGINITLVGSQHVLTPSHTGAQPATYSMNGQTIRPLGKENDKAFALINALNAAQRKQAMLDYYIADGVLGPGHDGEVIQPEGVRAATFTERQQAMLLDLVQEWVSIINETDAKAKMAEVKRNLADTFFAWSGPTTNGSASYFRIQGPTVEIEYAPQCVAVPCGSGRPSPDHIHTFYRDPTNDYGAKLIAR